MNETIMTNIRIPSCLETELKKASSKEYLSVGEFVRSAAIRFLIRLNLLSNSVVIDLLGKMSKTRTTPFDEEKELADLRKLRQQIWEEKYDKGSP